MNLSRKYEVIILLTEEFNESELKIWVLNFAKSLRKFNVYDTSVISRGKQKLSYPIRDRFRGNCIQLNFSGIPRYVETGLQRLKGDNNILRFLLVKNEN